ncbi:SARP family transcriptional regulator [Rhizocola hellebori]|uniref:SARP family transcriptional regulator n=2 Tax=Rhizocola hellebori TaxID=1392758 RepID=A0A8J3QCN0_9ACTN|nr:SARP family transcriptional regulator [Rhizocola hellebori]
MAVDGDSRLELGRRKERCLLGLLLLEAGRVVPRERLFELLWDGRPPASARAALHTYVTRLRGGLSAHGVQVVMKGDGYLVEVDRASVDVHRFSAALARARGIADPLDRAAELEEALRLWRGQLLADVAGDGLRERLGTALEDQRLEALELKAEADLALGRAAQAAGQLAALSQAHPTRERLVELLMLARYRQGRQVDALAAFRALRERLVAELGVEPTPQLHALHRRILTNDPELTAASPVAARRFLPRSVPGFTGRREELLTLDRIAREQPDSSTTVVIGAVTGLGGVGKTALAVRWAHLSADRFPDGQFYVNLRGYSPGEPMRAAEALTQLLRALGVAADRLPSTVDEAADLYRSLVAQRSVLILLDNALSADQVRPLLPGGPRNLVLITSRDKLSGLVAIDGARRLTVAELTEADAFELLRHVLGRSRVEAEPEATRELSAWCGNLPLALRIAAATLADDPHQTIADYITDLRNRDRIAALAIADDPAHALTTVFGQSYRHLSEVDGRLFRLLGLLTSGDFSSAAAAALADLTVPDTEAALTRLSQAHLVTQERPGRFGMHDLVREFASGLAPGDESHAAMRRLATWQLDRLAAVAEILPGFRVRLSVSTSAPFPTEAAATSWLEAEADTVISALTCYTKAGWHDDVWHLAGLLREPLRRSGRADEWNTVAQIGLDSAIEVGDGYGEAYMRDMLAGCYQDRRMIAEAVAEHRRARALYLQVDDHLGAANCADALGVLHQQLGDLVEAEQLHGEAHAALGYLEDPILGTHSRIHYGTLLGRLGRLTEAAAQFRLALAGAAAINDLFLACFAHHNLAFALLRMQRHEEGARHARAEIELAQLAGSLDRAARGWEMLGDCLFDDDHPQAMEAYRRALELYERQRDSQGEELRHRIDRPR